VAAAEPADWTATAYPPEDELQDLRKKVLALPDARKRLQQTREVADRWRGLRSQLDQAQRTLDGMEAGLPKGVTSLRERHARLKREEGELKERMGRNRTRLAEEQKNRERIGRERDEVFLQKAGKDQELQSEQVRREAAGEALARARAALPADWQPQADAAGATDLQRWRDEQAALERQGTEARAAETAQARGGLEPVRHRVEDLEREQDAVPEEARCAPAEVRQRLTAVRQEQARKDKDLRQAQADSDRLAERRRQRQQLHEQYLQTDRLHNRYRLLAEFLGPERLQLHLVRQAERGIVTQATAVLDRVSGGQLYLRLRSESEDGLERALQLDAYNRSTGQEPIGVEFLSGSQRFRVAVSLALGIGQYASRQHRP